MAGYSYDEVITALRNADAAGDTEAATRLAEIAKTLKQQPASDWHNELRVGAKQGLQRGLASTAKLGAELAATGESLFTGNKDTDTLGRTNKAIEGFFGTDKLQEMHSIPGIAAETATNVLPFAANLPLAGLGMAGMYNDQVNALQDKNVPLSDARQAAGANIAAMTATGGAAGMATKKLASGLLGRFAGGAGGFAGGAEAGRQVQNSMLEQYPEAQQAFDPKHAVAQALVGGGLGIAHTQNKRTVEKKPSPAIAEDFQAAQEALASTQKTVEPVKAESVYDMTAVDSEMMQYPQDLQAPQFGMGGRVAKHADQVGRRETPKFEPGERTTQTEMDMEQQKLATEQKQVEIDKAWESLQKSGTLSKEEAFREQERLQKEQEALDEQRRTLFEDEANDTLKEPEQHGQGVPVETNDTLGQSSFGKSQRGSIGFKTDPKEDYFKEFKKSYPDASPELLEKAWEIRQAKTTSVQEKDVKTSVLSNMIKKAGSGLEEFIQPWKDQHTDDVAIEAIKVSPDNSDTTLGLTRNYLTAKGRLGVQTHKNAGIRNGISRMVTIKEENAIAGNTLLNDQRAGILSQLRSLESLHGEGLAGKVFDYVIKKQLNPEFETNLTPEVRKVVDNYKRVTDGVWDTIIETYSKLDPEKATKLQKLKQEWYLPHRFDGDFASYVHLKNPNGSQGKLVAYLPEYSMKDAQTAAQYYRDTLSSDYIITDAKYIGDKGKVLSKKAQEGLRGAQLQEGMSGKFEALLDLLTTDDLEVQQAQKAVQAVINRRAKTSEQMNDRLKVNTNVEGFWGNKPWKSQRENYYDAKDSFERYVEGAYQWKSAMEMAQFLSKLKEAAPDKANTYATLVEQFKAMSGLNRPPKHPFIQDLEQWVAKNTGFGGKGISSGVSTISNYATAMQTGVWNYIMGLQNITQAGVTSVNLGAILAAHGGSLDPTALASKILSAGIDSAFGRSARPVEFDYATTHEINKLGLLESHAKTKAGSAVKDWGVNKLTQQTEAVSRLSVFYGITDYLVDNGVPKETAMEVSKNMTRDYMVNYEDYARPGITTQTGPLGASLGRLQTFSANAFTQFIQTTQMAWEAARTNNPKLALPLAAYMATSIFVAGVNGTIPMDVVEKLWNWGQLFGWLPPDQRSPRQYMFEEYPNLAVGSMSLLTDKYLDPSFRSSIPFIGLPPVWGIMGTRLQDAGNLLEWGKNGLKGLDTSLATKYKAVSSVTPTGWRGIPEQELMVNKETGTYYSPSTELPQYTPSNPNENSALKYTNVRSLGRGVTAEQGFLAKNREHRISTAIQDESKSIQKYIAGQLRATGGVDEKTLVTKLGKVYELGGDVEQTMNHMLDIAKYAGYDNQLVVDVVRSLEKNPFRAQRALRTLQGIDRVR